MREMMETKHRPYGPYEMYIKRPLDCFIAICAILVLFPVLLITAILVKVKLGSPVLFTQDRPGLNGKIFKLYKFRSMTDERDSNGNLLPDADRLPPFGRKLRSTSLDELPELLNIVKGDMSLVGPRPLLVKYLPLYNSEQRKRHDVRPGLTGYAQVHGRNAISWEERFKFDVEYTKRVTFSNDIKIIFETVMVVLKKDGINSGSCETMEAFTGTKPTE